MNDVARSPTASEADGPWHAAAALREQWYVACAARELRPGTPLAAKILGRGLVLFRCRDGTVTALLDQCLHRGTRLSAGTLRADCLTCPYHGWRYDHEGRVVHIPTLDGRGEPGAPHNFKLRKFATDERDGLVWVYLGEEDAAARPIFRMPFFDDPRWVCYYMLNTFDGEVGALAQNFMDVPHTVFVHDAIFRSSPGKAMRTTVETKPASVEVTYHEADDNIGLMPWLTNPQRAPLTHTDKFFAPNVTRCDYHWGEASAFVITSQMTPLDERRCRVYTLISYKFPLPRVVLGLLRPFIHLYTRIVIGQDVRIMRINRQGLDNAGDFKPHSVRADIVHVAIDKLIAATREGRALPESALGVKAMDFEL